MLLSFESLDDGPGLEIVDHVERRQCQVRTSRPIDPVETSVEDFEFPVDRGVRFDAASLTIPHRMPVFLWNSMGFQFDELTKGEARDLPEDRYIIDMFAPVRLYVVVESELSIEADADGVDLAFGGTREVLACARSYHKHPAATITTTRDPEDMMAAVSALSSALKTTSVERSYPTLRGHPPTIELGDALDVPEALEPPDTGVTIEVPSALRYVYVVAPLAYYLGAEVVPGPVPRIITENGFEHELDDPRRGFEGEVERVLKQTFFLDCLTRTEGFYPVNLHERNVLEDDLDLDLAALYGASISEQLEAYLAVPYEVVEPEVPDWKLTTHIDLVPEHVEILPFVVNDLAVVRSPRTQEIDAGGAAYGDLEQPVRSGDFTRGAADSSTAAADTAAAPPLVRPEQADSVEQAWVGEGAPIGASKAMIEAYRNRLDRKPTDGDIDITVVCNDTAMNDERDIVDDIYGSRDELPFDIHGHHAVTVDELAHVLQQPTDFLHYIGHIDERGFECSDGFLDAGSLDHTGVDAFLLNACTSYRQGMELIRAGSVAGVVTVEDVINSGAERIGSSLAKLLNQGFPFNAALTIAKDESIVGSLYLVLGDGGIDIAQAESVPGFCHLSEEDPTRLTFETFTTFEKGLGTIVIPHAGENAEYYLASGESGIFNLSQAQLDEYLSTFIQPVQYEGRIYWTDETDTAVFLGES